MSVTLQLGDASIEILEFDHPGRPYVQDLSPYDNEFQHFALVVKDMGAAFSRLSALAGWSSISTAGPQQLPASSGGVEAFKFRDPDGHPLELLGFHRDNTPNHRRDLPGERLFLGIDHSAMSCSNAAASIGFYREMGDIAATRLIFERDTTPSSGATETLILDPDGHHLLVTSTAPGIPALN